MTRHPAPHYSYPKRDGYFADTKRMGCAPEAPMAVDVPEDYSRYMNDPRRPRYDFVDDVNTDQCDLALIVRKVNRALFFGVLVMIGWVAGSLMALAVLKGVW